MAQTKFLSLGSLSIMHLHFWELKLVGGIEDQMNGMVWTHFICSFLHCIKYRQIGSNKWFLLIVFAFTVSM